MSKRRSTRQLVPMPDMSWLHGSNVYGSVHERAARVLGWTVPQTQSMSLATLREMVRGNATDPTLYNDMTKQIGSGSHVAGSRNRVMGPARRRNAPSRMFHAVIDRGGGVQGMFQPEIVGSDASLSTVRVRAKIAADTSGMPVAVMDDHHKVIKVYKPTAGPASGASAANAAIREHGW